METENLISYDDVIDVAYDIFLEMAADNLEPADVLLFTMQPPPIISGILLQ